MLATVGVLEEGVDVGRDGDDPCRRQTPHGVPALDRLDLDDLGAPVRQQGRCGRHVRVLGHLQDANALHDCGHEPLPESLCC